jgi:hypothetical protein
MIKTTVCIILLALGLSVRAQIIIPSATVTFNALSNPGYQLSITYEVTDTGGLYTYSYDLVTTPAVKLTSFTIGGTPDPVDIDSVAIQNAGGIDFGNSGAIDGSIDFAWDLNPGTTSSDVSYTSTNAPTMATFTVNDDGLEWGSPASIPAPTAVPEAPTILAGALMILPLGVAGFRALRRDRSLH